MLSKFDDYPIHQTPEPIAVTASTDRNAYDRYWFNGYTDDGEFYFGVGAALYPNLGIMDCGFSIVRDGEQHAFHASRRAPREPSQVQVGPFRIEIIEPLKALRVDYVKVDGTIVRNILRAGGAAAKLKAIVRVGEVTGVGVIAECVEEDEILANLKLLKVGYAQGFGMHKPAPIEGLFRS